MKLPQQRLTLGLSVCARPAGQPQIPQARYDLTLGMQGCVLTWQHCSTLGELPNTLRLSEFSAHEHVSAGLPKSHYPVYRGAALSFSNSGQEDFIQGQCSRPDNDLHCTKKGN